MYPEGSAAGFGFDFQLPSYDITKFLTGDFLLLYLSSMKLNKQE